MIANFGCTLMLIYLVILGGASVKFFSNWKVLLHLKLFSNYCTVLKCNRLNSLVEMTQIIWVIHFKLLRPICELEESVSQTSSNSLCHSALYKINDNWIPSWIICLYDNQRVERNSSSDWSLLYVFVCGSVQDFCFGFFVCFGCGVGWLVWFFGTFLDKAKHLFPDAE